jgi:inosose dehydratase
MTDDRVAVANAPCSYGAFEITVGVDPSVPPAVQLLDAVSSAGYAGIDLGPLGYLGDRTELPRRLRERALVLAGGYFEIAFSDPQSWPEGLRRLDALLDVFDACGNGKQAPKPTFADAGSAARAQHPGAAQRDRTLGWDDAGWRQFADGLAQFATRSRERGYEPTFHPHTATYVEAPWEIERMLESSDVGVCLDTGHLLLAGGDPVAAVSDWGRRLNHVHLKDARLDVIAGIVADRAPVEEIWRRRAFCKLGAGDVKLDAALEQLRSGGYTGWVVVEQDIFPDVPGAVRDATADQVSNREYLTKHGF